MGLNPEIWCGKRILVTGHTGFKGSWLTLLIKNLGAEVIGISLPPADPPSLYNDAKIYEETSFEFFQDIRDYSSIAKVIRDSKVDYVFHLAAQAFVHKSVKDPLESVSTNVMGTAHVLLAALGLEDLLGITIATTDKVYENLSESPPYVESDKLGGKDPYSASKAATELIVAALDHSSNPFSIPVTTVRAGNVIGGGDWGENRLVPDLVRKFMVDSTLIIRNPNSTRPWQYILDCLYGYLLVAQSHMEKKVDTPKSINFGPRNSLSVLELVALFESAFDKKVEYQIVKSAIPESERLRIDPSLAHRYFGWEASLSPDQAVLQTANWYSEYIKGKEAKDLMRAEIAEYKVGKW